MILHQCDQAPGAKSISLTAGRVSVSRTADLHQQIFSGGRSLAARDGFAHETFASNRPSRQEDEMR